MWKYLFFPNSLKLCVLIPHHLGNLGSGVPVKTVLKHGTWPRHLGSEDKSMVKENTGES